METRGRNAAEVARLKQEFVELYEAMAPKLVSDLARAYRSRATAEEVVQQAFERAWKIWGREEIRNRDAWITQIAGNIARDRWAYDRLRTIPEILRRFGAGGESVDPQDAAIGGDILENLPPRDRLIMLWRFRDGLSEKDIAERIGKTTRTVRERIAKSKEAVRSELIRDGELLPLSPPPAVEGVE